VDGDEAEAWWHDRDAGAESTDVDGDEAEAWSDDRDAGAASTAVDGGTMTGPIDPDATRPFPGVDETQPVRQAPAGPPPGGPPEGPYDDGADDDGDRRKWWWLAAGALAAGILVGVVVALLASGGDDEANDATTTTSTSTTTSSTIPVTAPPPTAPPTTPQAPGQVMNLTAGPGGGSGEVSLQWDSVPGAASYRVYRSSTMGTSGALIATVNGTSYTDVPGATAYYQVSAVSSGGLEGPRSVEACGAPVGESC
jgi:hypothetical protein